MKENTIKVLDYYRGGVQEKAEGERLLREERWEEAMDHYIKSDRSFDVVLYYLPEDEGYRNIYGDHFIIYMPNLLIADKQDKLLKIYRRFKIDDDIYWAKRRGKWYLTQSLKSVKTEWGFQIDKELEEKLK